MSLSKCFVNVFFLLALDQASNSRHYYMGASIVYPRLLDNHNSTFSSFSPFWCHSRAGLMEAATHSSFSCSIFFSLSQLFLSSLIKNSLVGTLLTLIPSTRRRFENVGSQLVIYLGPRNFGILNFQQSHSEHMFALHVCNT